jgi:hypothetical protein
MAQPNKTPKKILLNHSPDNWEVVNTSAPAAMEAIKNTAIMRHMRLGLLGCMLVQIY